MKHTPRTLPTWPFPYAIDAWLYGFDYTFGYQIKLVRAFWGIPHDAT